jgi:hypothetical protein
LGLTCGVLGTLHLAVDLEEIIGWEDKIWRWSRSGFDRRDQAWRNQGWLADHPPPDGMNRAVGLTCRRGWSFTSALAFEAIPVELRLIFAAWQAGRLISPLPDAARRAADYVDTGVTHFRSASNQPDQA